MKKYKTTKNKKEKENEFAEEIVEKIIGEYKD